MFIFRPQSASVLAVGCQTCILLWKVDPNSLATRYGDSRGTIICFVNAKYSFCGNLD